MAKAKKSSDKGVLYKKFTCTPWVQNLLWIPRKNVLLLIQNIKQGKQWRFTYLDFAKSIETGTQQVLTVVDIDRADELEGFAFLNNHYASGIAVTSSRKNNVNIMNVKW